jgi:hypothetical protein
MTAFELYDVYSEDGYFPPLPGSKNKMGLYGWSYFTKGAVKPLPWVIMIFDRHVLASKSAPVVVVKEARYMNAEKKFVEFDMVKMPETVAEIQKEYGDVDHDAVFQRNTARLRRAAAKIIKRDEN